MQALLTNIELDIQELKYLMDAFSREPNAALREVLKRSILQMRAAGSIVVRAGCGTEVF